MTAAIKNQNKKITRNCLIRIKSVYETLKSAEKRAADYLLRNPAEISGSTITEAAQAISCSEATLVRLAKKLGFNGYPDLKTSITEDRQDIGQGILYDEIRPDDSPRAVVEKVFQTSVRCLMDTFNLIDEKMYQDALSFILGADHILFAGSGDAYTVAYTGFLKFTRIGFRALCMQDYDIQLIEASKMTPKDMFIAVSHTGRTKNLYEVARLAKQRGAKIVTITNYPKSPLAKISDAVLLTAAFVSDNFGEIMTKRIPELCILETLYVNAIMRCDKKILNTLSNANSAIIQNKM